MESWAGQQSTEFQLGDRVRLKSDGADGLEWHVVARSFVRRTYDLMNCDARSPNQFQHGVEPELLEWIAADSAAVV